MKTAMLRFVVSLAGALLASTQLSARIVNLSTRGTIGAGDRRLVTGFVIVGDDAKQVLVRGVGPGLALFGVRDAAASLMIQVFDATGAVVAQNDGFQTAPDVAALEQTATRVGAFPLSAPGDSALVTWLAPGGYTVVVTAGGDGSARGTALVEVYDADGPAATSTLANISGRGMVGIGRNVLLTGFVIAGESPHRLLIRGIGRDLATYGINHPAWTVGVTVFNPAGNIVATSEIFAPPALEDDMAVDMGAFRMIADGGSVAVVVLAPGAYTLAIAPSSANAETDIGLLEVYDAGEITGVIEFPAAPAPPFGARRE